MLIDLSVKDFLNKTASSSPVPGGGSMAALAGAVAAGLCEMVANLTIGRKGFEDVEEEMKDVAEKAIELRKNLTANIDRDSESYNEVMKAFKLPKDTDESRKERIRAIQDALKNAALVPLSVAKDAFNTMDLAEFVIKHGNKNAVTDGAVGVMMAKTAAFSALYNVKINLGSIKDESFVEKISGVVTKLESEVTAKEKQILSMVKL